MYKMQEMKTTPRGRTSSPLLKVSQATLQYQTRKYLVTATYRVSFDVSEGERFVLLGPSGCGKSTILKAIGGFIQPTEGSIHIRDKVVQNPGPDRMMVFQEFDQLLPWKTVIQNVAFPLVKSGRCNWKEAVRRADKYVEMVNLTKFASNYPHTLSGGMKQRAAIARGMIMEPDVLLMDEPYAALDALTRRKMQDELLRLWDQVKFTLVFITHSIEEAIRIGTRIIVLSSHPGQIRANIDGIPPEQQNPENMGMLTTRIRDMLFAG